MTQTCSKCQITKPLSENFHWRKDRQRYTTVCFECLAARKRKRYQKDPETYRAATNKWRKKNPGHYSAYHKEYMTDPEYRERKRTQGEVWREENRDRHRENARNWRFKNPEKYAAYHQRPDRKLHSAMRSGIHRCLKKGEKNGRSWLEFVGFTRDELMTHLEALFQPGMTWDNYGQWHVDHKKPLSQFAFNGPDDPMLKEAWALENLQPLWAEDNLKKGARFIG